MLGFRMSVILLGTSDGIQKVSVVNCADASKPICTATPTINHGKLRHSTALSELRPPFLTGAQRSVNREVQGSNPWSGAKPGFEICLLSSNGLAAVQQPYSNRLRSLAPARVVLLDRLVLV
jgi:hypothetical protein